MNTCGAIPACSTFLSGASGVLPIALGKMPRTAHGYPARGAGLCGSTSAVTAFACEGPRQVRNGLSQTPEGVLTTIADVMSSLGTSLTTSGSVASTATGTRQEKLLLSWPGAYADHLQARWSESDVRRYLAEQARRTVADLKRGVAWPGRLPRAMSTHIPVVERPDDIMIIAAGGEEER